VITTSGIGLDLLEKPALSPDRIDSLQQPLQPTNTAETVNYVLSPATGA
jgi:hypothetical protein